jgi:hypothetical protein
MASKNVNQVQTRFEDGGSLTIGDGTDVLTVFNIMPGTFKHSMPKRTPLEHTDRGVQQQPVMGNDELGTVEFTLKVGKVTGDDLMTNLNVTPTTTNLVKEYTVTASVPGYRAGTTGDRFTTANAFLAEQMVRSAGTDFDTIQVKMKFRTATLATY